MNSMENADKGYFERFAFGDRPEMADELFSQKPLETAAFSARTSLRKKSHKN